MDAKEANLVGKHNLRVLELIWGDDEPESQKKVEELLEALEPHSNLENTISVGSYAALTSLPEWLSLELAWRFEKGKGEDWYKIAHVPKVYVHSNVDVPPAKPKAFSFWMVK
ncbi:hypothetical protein Vadar_015348 [Vaccinium darrowii]|uniref:Uncharacterized protein n=1 Tax=Vaccinium darrowii TaxID=229202 RepID=A0ACB7ZCC5_9ERIC|nr:hypothetical protein Vadar_015348 [Vaccinium darrowii]